MNRSGAQSGARPSQGQLGSGQAGGRGGAGSAQAGTANRGGAAGAGSSDRVGNRNVPPSTGGGGGAKGASGGAFSGTSGGGSAARSSSSRGASSMGGGGGARCGGLEKIRGSERLAAPWPFRSVPARGKQGVFGRLDCGAGYAVIASWPLSDFSPREFLSRPHHVLENNLRKKTPKYPTISSCWTQIEARRFSNIGFPE
jgi:hypothetical protein